jgi:deoxycytidine triphosphate deaminase
MQAVETQFQEAGRKLSPSHCRNALYALTSSGVIKADPRWHNSKLTLELKNELSHHQILLKTGMKIGQIIFYRVTPVPEEHSYAVKGRYNNTTEVTASKGV